MSKLVRIIETADAITAEATAYVWEEYAAPRKRVPRARIVEHRFSVSIPKATEEAAPVAFVVEHFPQMVGRDLEEYRAGYDEPIRYHRGNFYTPARLDYRHRYGTPNDLESTDPRERLTAVIKYLRDVSDTDREKYAPAIERHDMRADQWPVTCGKTAANIEEEARRDVSRIIIIGGEIWQQCNEPVYEYVHPGWFSSKPGYINVSTDYSARNMCDKYGALDAVALAYYYPDATRYEFIDVRRPDLVTIDGTARKLAEKDERKQAAAAEILEKVKRLQSELAKKQAEADEAREELEAYTADPRAYWLSKCERLEALEDGTPFKAHRSRCAAAARRAFDKEA